MSLLQATALSTFQDTLTTDEKRYDKQGLIKAVTENTMKVGYISPDLEEKMRTFSSERDFEIPVIKEGEATYTLTPGFDNIPENLTESDTYGFTAVDIFSGFHHYPAQYAENVVKEEFDINVKMKRALYTCANAAEEAVISVLENNCTKTLGFLTQANAGEGTFTFDTGVTNTLSVNKAGLKDTLYFDYNNITSNNELYADNLLITSKGGTNEITKQMNKLGVANSMNLNWSKDLIEQGKIYETHNIAAGSDIFNGFLLQENAVGIYGNFPYSFRMGDKVGTKEWSISATKLPFINMRANVIIDRNAVNATAKINRGSDSTMTVSESMGLWFRFYITHPYTSDSTNRVAEIIKVKATNSSDMEGNKLSLGILGTAQSFPVEALTIKGQKETLVVDAIADSVIVDKTGILIVEADDDSAVFNIHVASGTPVITKAFGSTVLTVTKDSATKVNLFVEDGVIKIQNKLITTVDVTVKAFI